MLAGAGGPDPRISSVMLQYAKHIRKDAVYMGLGDLAAYAFTRKKDVMLLYFDDESTGAPVTRSLFDAKKAPLGDEAKAAEPFGQQEEEEEADMEDEAVPLKAGEPDEDEPEDSAASCLSPHY